MVDFDASTIEFLSVGDLLSQTIRLYWKNILMILQVLLAPAIGCTIGKIFMHWPFSLYSLIGLAPSILIFLVGFIILVYSIWILMLRQFALVKLFVGLGQVLDKENFYAAYKLVLSMQGRILAVFSLSAIASAVTAFIWSIIIIVTAALARTHLFPFGLLIASVILEFIGMFLSVAVVTIIYWLALTKLILEEGSIDQSISESWTLTLNDFWRVLYFICLSFLIVSLLTLPLSLPLAAISFIEMLIQSNRNIFYNIYQQAASYGTKAPFYKLVSFQIWESLVNVTTWPMVYLGWGLFYKDLRKRLFAGDLTQIVEKNLLES